MSTPAVDELTRFIANPAPEPIARQFGVLYCEVLNLVRLAMIPGGWLPDPTAFQPGPGAQNHSPPPATWPRRSSISNTRTGCRVRRRRSRSCFDGLWRPMGSSNYG